MKSTAPLPLCEHKIFNRYNDWVRLVLYEVLEFSAVVYCCVLFRLQDFEDYNNIVISTPFHEVTVVLTPNKHLVYISNQQEEAETSDDKWRLAVIFGCYGYTWLLWFLSVL